MLLHFPNEATIKNYLQNEHHLTKDDHYLQEKKVLEAAAKIFANQEKSSTEVDTDLSLMLCGIGYDVPQPAIVTTMINLSAALKDCAEGKKF